MRCFWEQPDLLGPIYRCCLNDGDIPGTLNLPEVNLQSGIAWILRS